jgi:flagellar basal body-associated protein FliL
MNLVSETKKKEKPLYLQEIEARELGRLIEEDELADKEKDKLVNRIKDAFQNVNSNKKVVGFFVLLFVVLLSVILWLTFSDNVQESRINIFKTERGASGQGNSSGIKPIVFKLDSFFLPLMKGGKETGQFLSIKAELTLSNKIVLREVEQALPLIRQNIFSILKRKKVKEFIDRKKLIENQIKKEIIATTNATLISGVGSVEDVFFSEFSIN